MHGGAAHALTYAAMRFNRFNARLITQEAFGVACYERAEPADGTMDGTYLHRGVVATKAEGQAWLSGDPEIKPLVVFPADKKP